MSIEDLDIMAWTLPHLVAEVKKGKHSPNLIRDLVLKELTGGTMCTLKCKLCGNAFPADKQLTAGVYICPHCSTTGATEVIRDEANILNAALAPKKKTVITQTVIPVQHSKPSDKQP